MLADKQAECPTIKTKGAAGEGSGAVCRAQNEGKKLSKSNNVHNITEVLHRNKGAKSTKQDNNSRTGGRA